MKQIITAKLKLQPNSEQYKALRATSLAYRDALNTVSQYAFAHGKTSNQQALQRGCYEEIRRVHRLPAQMACNVPRQVGATYKALRARAHQNTVLRQAGLTKKRYKGLDHAPRYVSPTLTYNYHRDYSLKADQMVSILTLGGRVIVPYVGYAKHVVLIRHSAHIGAAKLWLDKPRKQFYLLISLELEVTEPTPTSHKRIVGVDIGQRYLAVTTDTENHTAFYSGTWVRAKAEHFTRLTKRLQHKGTRSAKRRLVAISGRERRLKQDCNHVVSRRIVDAYPHSLIGLESLTHIRENMPRRHKRGASQKQRKASRRTATWAVAEMQRDIAYKALLAGSMALTVDASCTSQACPRCGYTSPRNRPNHGLIFVCQACHHTLHADLVGARNIALRALLARQDWARTGALSWYPDVSDVDTKAAQRQRYAELRWSPDVSPILIEDRGS